MSIKRLDCDRAILFVCDIQENFAPKSYGFEGAIEASIMMIKAAKIFNIPIITTQHNRKIFGQTSKQLKEELPQSNTVLQKSLFSMLTPQTQSILKRNNNRNQVILIGMETHICILQTCLDLLHKNYQVFVLVDAVTSLRSWQRSIALKRMQKEGAILTSFQSSAFELLRDAKDPRFKQILNIVKKYGRQKAISHL